MNSLIKTVIALVAIGATQSEAKERPVLTPKVQSTDRGSPQVQSVAC